MHCFLVFLLFVLPVFSCDIIVNGSGVVGVWSAYSLSEELEKEGLGEQVMIHLVSQVDWLENTPAGEITVFDQETSGWGPAGLQLEEIVPWNSKSLLSSFYVSPDISEEGKKVVDQFIYWHENHPETEEGRFGAYEFINRFAKEQWFAFYAALSNEERKALDCSLEGAWALKESDQAIAELMTTHKGVACLDSGLLAQKLPFYHSYVLEKDLKGFLIEDHGVVDSQKLREWMWGKLFEKRGGKPAVTLHLGKRVERLLMSEEGVCKGVQFEDGSIQEADLTLLATGYGTKALVKDLGIDLPLTKLWGAAVKAVLKKEAFNHFPGPLGLNGLYVMLLGNKKITAVGPHSFFLPENTVPAPLLFKERLRSSLLERYKDKIDTSTIQYYLAPRTLVPDELPVIDFEHTVPNLLILLPTYHLGLTQSIALAKLAAMHTLNKLGKNQAMPCSLDPYSVDRFK